MIDLDQISRIAQNAEQITALLQKASESFHLIAPATACPVLPPGCGVAFSAITISPDPDRGDVYPTGAGRVGLHKSSLDRIGAALGVSWDAKGTRRLDDRSHPFYCEYVVVGAYQRFDGSWAQIMDHKVVDLRDGSAQIDQIIRQAKEGRDPWVQIEFMRAHIASHCLTKARLRALRTVGLRTSYIPAELAKPFLVAKLTFTGQTDDPAMKPVFAAAVTLNMLAGARMAFGQGASESLAAAMTTPVGVLLPPGRHAPPPVCATPPDDDDMPPFPAQDSPKAASIPMPAPSHGQTPPRGSQGPTAGQGEPVVAFGRNKGMPLSQLSKDELGWYLNALKQSVADPEKAQWKAQNEARLEEARMEVRRRQQIALASGQPSTGGSQ